jgi:hypothetical protein
LVQRPHPREKAKQEGSAQAAALLTGPHTLIAPDLIIAEVANAGWKAVRSGGMTRDQHDHAAAGCRWRSTTWFRLHRWRRGRWQSRGTWIIRIMIVSTLPWLNSGKPRW